MSGATGRDDPAAVTAAVTAPVSLDERVRLLDGARGDIAATLGALGGELRSSLDWRRPVRRHPLLSVTVAAGLGLWLGLRVRRPPPPARPRRGVVERSDAAGSVLGTVAMAAAPLLGHILRRLLPVVLDQAGDAVVRGLARRRRAAGRGRGDDAAGGE
jgi:hypothetical protein